MGNRPTIDPDATPPLPTPPRSGHTTTKTKNCCCLDCDVEASCLVCWEAAPGCNSDDSLLVGTWDGRIHWYRPPNLEYGASIMECLSVARRNGGQEPRAMHAGFALSRILKFLVAPSHAGWTDGNGVERRSHRPDFLTLHHNDFYGSTIFPWTERRSNGTSRPTSASSDSEPVAAPFELEEVIRLLYSMYC